MNIFSTESHPDKFNKETNRKLIVQVVLSLLLSLLIAPLSFAATPYCSNIFQNGLQTHGADGSIIFGKNSRLIHPYDTRLNTPTVTIDTTSGLKTCGKRECTAAGITVDGLQVYQKDIWPERDANAPDNQTTFIGSNEHTAFRQVLVGNNATAIFVANTHYYTIDTLKLGYNSTLQLPAGDYWINQFSALANAKIDVIGEGQVTLFVRDDFKLPLNFKVNENTKDPSRISIYTYASSEYGRGSRTYAFIRSQSNATLKNQARIDGGLLANSIVLESSSIVVFDSNAVDKMSFNYFCSGYVPYVDVTPPQINVVEPGETSEPQVTLTGTVRDPGGIKKAMLRYGDTEILLSLVNDQFSVELPLLVGRNTFYIEATDEAGNHNVLEVFLTRQGIAGFGFLFDSYETFSIADSLDVTGTINTPEGHTVSGGFVQTASGDVPLQLVGNKFSVALPLNMGFNEYNFIAFDQYGNRTAEILQAGGLEGVELHGVKIVPEFVGGPTREISGEVHSFWPRETLVATLEGEPLELIRVTDVISRFQKTITLSVGRNRFDVQVEAPNGENTYGEYDVWYEPDRINLEITSPDSYPITTENETIILSGFLHLPDELIGVITGIVATSDQIPGIEIPVEWSPGTGNDSTFSVEIPLAVGDNKLRVKAKKGTEDFIAELGWSQAELVVTRYPVE